MPDESPDQGDRADPIVRPDRSAEGADATSLVYFADPMCSWCWGFAPVVDAIRARYGDRLPVRLILGGLAIGTTRPLDQHGKQSIRDHWRHVVELTGQPFDVGFFEREGFVYDTEPACRAVVAARRLTAGSGIEFLHHLQRGFYAANQDVTDRATLALLAETFGIERSRFEAELEADATSAETAADFRITRNTGIDGYPALLIGNRRRGYAFVTLGYQPWQTIEGMIDSWLADHGERIAS